MKHIDDEDDDDDDEIMDDLSDEDWEVEMSRAHSEEESEKAGLVSEDLALRLPNEIVVEFCCEKMEEQLRKNNVIRAYRFANNITEVVVYGETAILRMKYCCFCGERLAIRKPTPDDF
jgi:hypothetical protein